MSEIGLTLGCWDYDRTRALLDGRVGVEGCRVVPVNISPEDSFPRAVSRQELDVTELSVSSYLLQVSRGDCGYVGIPAFVSRGFRHGAVYVRTDRGIDTPKDLEGKIVGVPEYQMTLALWVRGILQDEYGVDFRSFQYRTGGLNSPGRKERLPLKLPDNMAVQPIAPDQSLNDLFVTGEIDAIMSPGPPSAFLDGHPQVRQLIADPPAAERAYYAKTGFFPIMHFIGLRKELAAAHPGLAARVFAAFVEAKRIGYAEVAAIAAAGANKVTLPWFAAELEATRALMGEDFWSYGVEPNRAELEAICRYSQEQFLAERALTVDELFAPETLEMRGL
jgi:4,5-dihydroxyphthalate decarboxylase